MSAITDQLKEEIRYTPRMKILLVLSSKDKYESVNLEILKLFSDSSYIIIYICVDKPSTTIRYELKAEGMNVDKMFFIDCATAIATGSSGRIEKAIVVSPKDLTDLSITINEAIQGIKENKIVFLDSLATLSIYHGLGTMKKFCHFLISNIRLYALKGILLSIEQGTKKELIDTIERFCDKTVRI